MPGLVPPPRSMRPALRGFWLTASAVTLALVVVGATLLNAHRQLSWAEAWVEQGSQRHASERAQRAIDGWMRPWVETFLRERGLEATGAEPLSLCASELIVAMDGVSEGANVVRQGSLDRALNRAKDCVGPTLSPPEDQRFVKELRLRWGRWLQDELGR